MTTARLPSWRHRSRCDTKRIGALVDELRAYGHSVLWYFGEPRLTIDGREWSIRPLWLTSADVELRAEASEITAYLRGARQR